MNRRYIFGLTVSLLVLVSACDNSFEPKADYQEQLVIYGVMSKSQEKQVIRLQSTYDAEFTNPDVPLNKRIIDDADVYVRDNNREYKFVKEEVADSNAAVPYIWTSTELEPVEGRNYALRVVMNGNTVATSSMQIPSRPFLEMYIDDISGSGVGGLRVGIGRISTVATPKGYYFRLFLRGTTPDGGSVQVEVPYVFDEQASEDEQYVYPSPGRETAVVFPTNFVKQWKTQLELDHLATDIKLVAVGSSMDTHFYNYYKVVRGFEDPVSVRQDNPNITNINGGLGVFGGMTVDTLIENYIDIIR